MFISSVALWECTVVHFLDFWPHNEDKHIPPLCLPPLLPVFAPTAVVMEVLEDGSGPVQ